MDDTESVRVGLVLLAEDYLRGVEDIFKNDGAVIKKFVNIVETVGQEAVESVLTDSPSLWFPNVMSSSLSSCISLLMILLCTTKPVVLHPSLQFCVCTLLPRLSELMGGMEMQDWDIGQATMGLIRKLQEYKPDMIKMELDKLKEPLNQDLEETLQQYLQY